MKSENGEILKMNYKFKKIFQIIITLILIIGFNSFAQETETNEEKNQPTEIQPLYSGSRGYTKAMAKEASVLNTGLQKYLRWAVHDGNLVYGGIVNSGLLSYHYVSGTPRLSWPKGSNAVEYLHSGVFYVAAEVQNTAGDTIHIVSDNYRRSSAEASLDQSHFYGFMPLPKYFNNHQEDALEYDIGGISEDVGEDGIPNSGDEGEGDGILQASEDVNDNDVLDLSLINSVGWFAISHRKETWPEYWPAGTYPGDDRAEGEERAGVRAGRWNGEFGAYIRADQESYFAFDDRENDEFDYYPFEDEESKLSWPDGRRGLGLSVEARNYQWNSRLAEDILISIYDITNNGKDLEKAVVGMYVDPDLGGNLSGDDASFDEVDDITYAFNLTGISSEGLPIGYFGFAFLESPGLPKDGIDNDEDGLVDESQSNGIDDDGDWTSWTDENGNGIWDNEDADHDGTLDAGEDTNGNGKLDVEPLNDDLGSDGLGPEYDEYTGPDSDGTEANGQPDDGEPNYEFTDNDESDQVGLTSFYLRDVDDTMANDEDYWRIEIAPGVFTVRPGYQRDIAWSYGSGYIKFAEDAKTHRYAIALLFGNDEDDILRNKKTMQVIYDEDYNFSKPPSQPVLTVTAGDKKVYLQWDKRAETSNDPIYGQDFEAYYIYKSTDPTFEDIKTITDAFANPLLFEPLEIYDLNNGLAGVHPVSIGSEIGAESDLGISYNMGTDSGLKHYYIDEDVTNGRTYYYAVVSLDQGYHPDFYLEITDREGLQTISPTECSATIQTDLLGRPISFDRNTAQVVPMEHTAGWVEPEVSDLGISHSSGNGTGEVTINIYNPNLVLPNASYELEFSDDESYEELGANYTGLTNRATILYNGDAIASLSDPDNNELAEEFMAHGLQIIMQNDTTKFDTAYWSSGSSNLIPVSTTEDDNGIAVPRDYEVRVSEIGADTSVNSNGIPTNFQIWDVTDEDNQFQVNFRLINSKEPKDTRGILSGGDKIQIVSDYSDTKRLWIFEFAYPDDITEDQETPPENGDVLYIKSKKAFDRNDLFEFTITGNDINTSKAKSDLDNIYTVPDPYIAASSLERKVINEEEGRGDRRIDFVNLPQQCTISIFTTSGKLVRKIEHSSEINQSRAIWDLRTRDGLEITHGIYFWVVEAPGIGKKAGRLAVIK
ncbi:MAG: hypothetical protein PVH88_05900 [Ignavibacteria bacterium]